MNFSLPPAPLDEPEMVRPETFEHIVLGMLHLVFSELLWDLWANVPVRMVYQAMRVKKYGESMKLSVAASNTKKQSGGNGIQAVCTFAHS